MSGHTPGPFRLIIGRKNEDGTPHEAEIVSKAFSQNYKTWLNERGVVKEEEETEYATWGQVSMGRFYGKHNGSGEGSGPKRMLSDEEAMANAQFALTALNCHEDLVEALRQIATPGSMGVTGIARAALLKAGVS